MVTTDPVDRSYPAKLLLFGEYAVLISGAAIAIPFKTYNGHWETSDNVSLPQWAHDWLAYLREHCSSFLDLEMIDGFLQRHIYVSDITIGAGIGSSGALTASLYDLGKSEEHSDLIIIKDRLALMESHFHGKSSGLDPLVSYLDQAIHQDSNKKITQINGIDLGSINAYLIDTKQPRQGKSYIQPFMEATAADPEPYMSYVEHSNKVVNSLINQSELAMADLLSLSACQYKLMPDMIIDGVRDLWKSGIESRRYAAKLCGAGGGGYYLVFSDEEMDQVGPYPLIKLQMP